MSLTPYNGTFGRPELRHLLGRTLFGCSEADLQHFAGQNLAQVVDALLDFSNDTTPPLKTYTHNVGGTPDPGAVDPDVPFGTTWVDTPRDPEAMVDTTIPRIVSFLSWRTGLMVQQQRNLREKLTLFWANTMPVQTAQVPHGRMLYDYDQVLRNHCKGNFRQLITEVTLSPAMLLYLNGTFNNVLQPDENYARELMELFTLGEGSGYQETDVQQAARVLTGWIIREQDNGVPILPETQFIPLLHDTGNKQFSNFFGNAAIAGQSGTNAGLNELNALLDLILSREAHALHVCREMYRFFVKGEIDAQVEAEVIAPLAELYRDQQDAPDHLEQVFRALFTSAHFFSADVRACRVKSPADLVIGGLRAFGMPFPTPQQVEAQYQIWRDVYFLTTYAGQEVFNPPNVAGWPAYHQAPNFDNIWVDTATFPLRNNAMLGIVAVGFATGNDLYQEESRNLSFKVDLLQLVAQFTDAYDPNALVEDAAGMLFAVPVSQGILQQLKTNYLLLGQQSDHYWTDAYELYVMDPETTDLTAQLVPFLLTALFADMVQAAEQHLH